ncbi:MAG: hypothetical protein C5B60_05775 [Chloroflexi bacterium]|nr:MAG: hypothetical protein C5B60_05775 [Chloroflexota bacterium]
MKETYIMSTDQNKPNQLTTHQSRSISEWEGASDGMQTARTGADDVWYAPKWRPLAFLGVLLMLSLAVSACGQGNSAAAKHHMPMSTAMPTGMMPLPSYAKDMHIAIASPASGTMVTDNALSVTVATSGYTLSCDFAGKADQQGIGHYHVLLDKSLVNMFCTPTATISMQNVSRGMHTLTVVPALNDHSEVEVNGKSIRFDYEPTNPLPALTDATFAGKPSITILSPKNGDTVSGAFDIIVQVTNYNLSCDLMGKPDVAGYGHWHANLDSMSGPMMGMGTMLGMSCSTLFHATTAGLKAGQTHTIIALLTDDGHAPLNPAVDSQVTVKIGG